MIHTQKEYKDACSFIDSDMELYDYTLSERMSSYEFNLYLQDTEYFLDFLYEKIRTLEELCDYLDTYIDKKTGQAREKIDKDIQAIQAIEGQVGEQIVPQWNAMQSKSLLDRDGNLLPAADNAGSISAAVFYSNEIRPTLLLKEEANEAYRDNLATALQDGYYLVSYQASQQKEIRDTVTVVLPVGAEYNYVKIQPYNCEIVISKTDTGVRLVMTPAGYDKEYRDFQYDTFRESNLNRLVQENGSYTPAKSVHENIEQYMDRNMYTINRNYLHEIQKTRKTRQQAEQKQTASGSKEWKPAI